MHTCLIPASGSASRMKGFPKFLLPSKKDSQTLLEVHLREASKICDEILIGVNPIFYDILANANLEMYGAKIVSLATNTMSETIIKLASHAKGEIFTVLMPDTVFVNAQENFLKANGESDLELGIWKIRADQIGKLGQISFDEELNVIDCVDKDENCNYEFAWGIQTFNRNFLNILKPEWPHIGYGILPAIDNNLNVKVRLIDGGYYDCGTQSEYIKYIKDGLP